MFLGSIRVEYFTSLTHRMFGVAEWPCCEEALSYFGFLVGHKIQRIRSLKLLFNVLEQVPRVPLFVRQDLTPEFEEKPSYVRIINQSCNEDSSNMLEDGR